MNSNNIRKSKELLIRCWMTQNGMWLFYCHLIDMRGAKELNAASPGHMGMRLIERSEDLENVLNEILSSLKKASPKYTLGFNVADSAEDRRPKRSADLKIEYPVILQNIEYIESTDIPSTKEDRSFCANISLLESFFKALPVKYSTTPSCADCILQKHESCLKEYRFSSVDYAKVDYSCPGFRGINLKGICCGIQTD